MRSRLKSGIKHPGAEYEAQAGLAQVDLSVRVLPKMRLDLLLLTPAKLVRQPHFET
jgi:hypothetical protein